MFVGLLSSAVELHLQVMKPDVHFGTDSCQQEDLKSTQEAHRQRFEPETFC